MARRSQRGTRLAAEAAAPAAEAAAPAAEGAPAGLADAGDRYALPHLPTLVPHKHVANSLAEKAYYLIRDRILRVELVPGAVLDERALMQELGLGRTPIREALHRLADDDLVEIVPRRGIFVTPIDIGDLGAISEVRVKLEEHAGRLAAERATAAERAHAADLLEHVAVRQPRAGQTELMELDQLVHRHVYRCTHNDYLAATLEDYFVLSLRLWFLVLDRVERLESAVQEHKGLLVAIRDREPDTAARVLRGHVKAFEQEIRRVL